MAGAAADNSVGVGGENMEDVIRVGIISAVDEKNGTARVYYPDRGSTTAPLQLFAFRKEYAPLKAGDQVLVLHLSNDTSSGIIMGRFWGSEEPPPQNVDYKKNFSENTYAELSDQVFTLYGTEIRLEGPEGSITLTKLLELERRVEELERRL